MGNLPHMFPWWTRWTHHWSQQQCSPRAVNRLWRQTHDREAEQQWKIAGFWSTSGCNIRHFLKTLPIRGSWEKQIQNCNTHCIDEFVFCSNKMRITWLNVLYPEEGKAKVLTLDDRSVCSLGVLRIFEVSISTLLESTLPSVHSAFPSVH